MAELAATRLGGGLADKRSEGVVDPSGPRRLPVVAPEREVPLREEGGERGPSGSEVLSPVHVHDGLRLSTVGMAHGAAPSWRVTRTRGEYLIPWGVYPRAWVQPQLVDESKEG